MFLQQMQPANVMQFISQPITEQYCEGVAPKCRKRRNFRSPRSVVIVGERLRSPQHFNFPCKLIGVRRTPITI